VGVRLAEAAARLAQQAADWRDGWRCWSGTIGQKLQDRLYEVHIDRVYPKKKMSVVTSVIGLYGKFEVISPISVTRLKGHDMRKRDASGFFL
jgi:hypothetical protein